MHDVLDDTVASQLESLQAQLDAALPPEVLRQEHLGESSLHYSHFLHYLAMGVHRGLHPLAQQRQADERWIERLSSRYHWHRRAVIWDDAVQRKEVRALFLHALDAITREERRAA